MASEAYRLNAAILAAAFLTGCATPPHQLADARLQSNIARVCAPKPMAKQATNISAPTSPERFRELSVRLVEQGFSRTAVDIGDVIGALPLLERLVALEAERARTAGSELKLELLRVRQGITDKILLALLDVSSTLAEIDCEGERGDQLRERLQRAENASARRLGLTTIMIGALTAALSGGLSLAGSASGGDIAAIVGGTTEASVATSLLFGSASSELRTKRNLLREVWETPDHSELFARPVWRFLTRRAADDGDRPTIAELLIAEWRAGQRLGPPGSDTERHRIELLFGSGGIFNVEELEMRDAMLDLLEASIALMSRDLRVLLDELLDREHMMPALAGARSGAGL